MTVAILYAMGKSIYHQLDGVEVYDIERDARNYYGPQPVVAHPPCAQWSILRGLARPRIEIAKYLAYHALECCEAFGGVLEHPASSGFWRSAGLPLPGEQSDRGCNLCVKHTWFGGPVEKPTGIFVAGARFSDLPDIPYSIASPTRRFESSARHKPGPKLLPKSQRSATPRAMAEWLVELAKASAALFGEQNGVAVKTDTDLDRANE